MADVSNINIGNTNYTIKDQTARDQLSNLGRVYSVSAQDDGQGSLTNYPGVLTITVPAGTYLIFMQGQTQRSESACIINYNSQGPWETGYLAIYPTKNPTAQFNTSTKQFVIGVNTSTELPFNYTVGWYHIDIFAVRIS